jgi:hypothetical protein
MKSADDLNDLIVEAEKVFAELRLRTPAWIKLDESHSLVWQKDGANWFFYVRYLNNGDMKKLHSAGLRQRAAAAKKLPELRNAILRAEMALVGEVQEAVFEADAFLASLRAPTDTSPIPPKESNG